MNKTLRFLLIPVIAATLSVPVFADSNGTLGTPDTVLNSSFVDFSPTVFDHAGAAGSPGNSMTSAMFTGGFMANRVNVSGVYDENPASTATISAEADIDFSGPSAFTYQHPFASDGSAWSGTQSITPVDPAGLWSFEFIDTFDDNDPSTFDATTSDFMVTFEEFGGGTPAMDSSGSFSLGSLGSPGVKEVASSVGEFLVADVFDQYSLTLNGDGELDFSTTEDPMGLSMGNVDTEIGIFDPSGVMVAYDDDDGTPFRYSAILDETLSAGAYTLVVSGFGSNMSSSGVGSLMLADVTGGSSFNTGDYALDVSFTQVPEPLAGLAGMLLGLAGLIGVRRHS